jgi:hypothetical protein
MLIITISRSCFAFAFQLISYSLQMRCNPGQFTAWLRIQSQQLQLVKTQRHIIIGPFCMDVASQKYIFCSE